VIKRHLIVRAAIMSMGIFLGPIVTIRAQDPSTGASGQEPGMEIMARGPIHEAFAEPVEASPQPGPIVPKQPPANVEEMPPDQRPDGANVQWIPGYWAWDDDRTDFIWISGIWRATPPDRQWVPGHWNQVDSGWQWVAGYWALGQSNQVSYLPPPPAPLNTGASIPAPTADSVYLPGSWVYVDARYLWRPGYWVTYRPGWIWVPAHYIWTPAGYIFVEGYWDYVLNKRGLMFAPIYFTRPLWTRRGWFYRPFYCVWDNLILTSLFVRPGYYHYYFGDYFEPAYTRLGFVPWFDFRFGARGYDPLFSYYRWSHRADAAWLYNMRALYAERYSGRAARPPRTLAQQNSVAVNNVRNLTMLAPINTVNGKMVTLHTVPRADLLKEQSQAKQLTVAAKQQSQLERQLQLKGIAPTREITKAQTVKIDLPRRPVAQGDRMVRPMPPPPPHGTIYHDIKPRVEEHGKARSDDKNK
jgi:hypothetical protein